MHCGRQSRTCNALSTSHVIPSTIFQHLEFMSPVRGGTLRQEADIHMSAVSQLLLLILLTFTSWLPSFAVPDRDYGEDPCSYATEVPE